MVEGEARRKGLRLTSTIDPGTPRRRMLSRDLVQQVLLNLLMNAVNFTAEGTVSVRVAGDATRLCSRSPTPDPAFPRASGGACSGSTDRLDLPELRGESTGLGLSITERFVRRMGGRIGSIERPGGGSVFWFELPSPEPANTEPATTEPATHEPEAAARQEHAPRGGDRASRAVAGNPPFADSARRRPGHDPNRDGRTISAPPGTSSPRSRTAKPRSPRSASGISTSS